MNIEEVEKFISVAKKLECKYQIIILKIPLEIALDRVTKRRIKDNLSLNSDYQDRVIKSWEIAEILSHKFPDSISIDVGDLETQQVVQLILNRINNSNQLVNTSSKIV